MIEVLEKLKEYTIANINTYVPTGYPEVKEVQLGEPDTTAKTGEVTIFITPDGETYESLSLESDAASATANVFILCQKASKEVLLSRVLIYAAAFKKMVRADSTLNGEVDEARIVNMEYYDGVEGTDSIKAVMVNVQLSYEEMY
jgi:hypothetical protein